LIFGLIIRDHTLSTVFKPLKRKLWFPITALITPNTSSGTLLRLGYLAIPFLMFYTYQWTCTLG
jgi:hypothetical protein